MKRILLRDDDFDLFDQELNEGDFEFFYRHKDVFKQMWMEQGKDFWLRFVLTYRKFSVNYGVIKAFPGDIDQFEHLIDDAFIMIHNAFVDGKFSQVDSLIVDIIIVAENRTKVKHLNYKNEKSPFYSKDCARVFKRFFGNPEIEEDDAHLKVYILLPLYIRFGGSLTQCMRRWLLAPIQDANDDSYWTPPVDVIVNEKLLIPGTHKDEISMNVIFWAYEQEWLKGNPTTPLYPVNWILKDPRCSDEDKNNPLYDKDCDRQDDWREGLTLEKYIKFYIYAVSKYNITGQPRDPVTAAKMVPVDFKMRATGATPKKMKSSRKHKNNKNLISDSSDSGEDDGRKVRDPKKVLQAISILQELDAKNEAGNKKLKDVKIEKPMSRLSEKEKEARLRAEAKKQDEAESVLSEEAQKEIISAMPRSMLQKIDEHEKRNSALISSDKEKNSFSLTLHFDRAEEEEDEDTRNFTKFVQNFVRTHGRFACEKNQKAKGTKDRLRRKQIEKQAAQKDEEPQPKSPASKLKDRVLKAANGEHSQSCKTKASQMSENSGSNSNKAEASKNKSESVTKSQKVDSVKHTPPSEPRRSNSNSNPQQGTTKDRGAKKVRDERKSDAGNGTKRVDSGRSREKPQQIPETTTTKKVMLRSCYSCGKQETESRSFKKCSKCKEDKVKNPRFYCGRQCQIDSWLAIHKEEHEQNRV